MPGDPGTDVVFRWSLLVHPGRPHYLLQAPFSLQLQCGSEAIRKRHGHCQKDISFADEIPLAEDHGFSMPFSQSRRYDLQERSHGYVLEAAHNVPGSDRRRKLFRLMFAEPSSGVDNIIP